MHIIVFFRTFVRKYVFIVLFMITPILLILIGLLIGVLVKVLGRWIPVPYTVALFAVGIGLGLLSQCSFCADWSFFTEGIHILRDLDPDFILYVFLPILVFDAAYEMDLHIFRKTLFNASMLAGPGLVICMLLTAAMVMGLHTLVSGAYDPSMWTYALMFGGLISATDPVAVVALLQELGTSKRFSTLVDGESLLNDGTGLVCFMMFYCQFAGKGSIDHPLLYFCWVVAASFVIGYVIYHAAMFLIRFVNEQILQNCILLAAAYATFMLAQSAFDVSGVIALVVFGHFFSQSGRPLLNQEMNEWMEKFWSLMAYVANTMIFLIVGVIIATNVHITWRMLLGVVVVYIGLNIIRYLMIVVLMPILRRSGYGLSWRESIILGWGGLRGALGMCMALMVNCNTAIPESIREHILVYTAGIVTLTLCINAMTSKSLVSRLHLAGEDSASEQHIHNRLLALIRRRDEQMLDTLKQDPYLADADWKRVEQKMVPAPAGFSMQSLSEDEMLAVIRRDLIAHMTATAHNYYYNGVLNLHSYRQIIASLSVLSDYEGTHPLDDHELLKFVKSRRWFCSRRTQLIDDCNLCRGYVIILTESLEFAQQSLNSRVLEEKMESHVLETVIGEIKLLLAESSALLDACRKADPKIFAQAITDKAIRVLLAGERKQVTSLLEEGVLTQEAADMLCADISRRQGSEVLSSM